MGKRLKKILIIDDSDLALKQSKDILEEANFEVLTRKTPLGVSVMIRLEQPNLILLDLNMPVMPGNKLVELLKSNRSIKHIPIFLLSMSSSEELKSVAKDCGADGFICKSGGDLNLVNDIRSWFLDNPVSEEVDDETSSLESSISEASVKEEPLPEKKIETKKERVADLNPREDASLSEEERRDDERFEAVQICELHGTDIIQAETHDISAKGAKISYVGKKMIGGTKLEIKIRDVSFARKAMVMWCRQEDERCQMGILFDKPLPEAVIKTMRI
ncbi:MAG: response regulator [Deltaproteobacteria bacterium]|nr:response regulator [Deltaproteobacteria bacterium]